MIKEENLKQITGYDNNGMLYDAENYILRKVNSDYFESVKEIFDFYQSWNSKNDIIETQIDENNKSLKHKKLFTSYPFEWTPNMFKDALIFHLELFLKLDKHGYTLKDGLPSNILFDRGKPVFVDFLSIVKTDNLLNETWLFDGKKYKEPRYAVFDKMVIPYMIIPFLAMSQKRYDLARNLLLDKACNLTEVAPSWDDITIKYDFKTKWKHFSRKLRGKQPVIDETLSKMCKFLQNKNKPFDIFCTELIEQIKNIDVTPPKSAYSTYYDEKNENFSFVENDNWKDKQRNVFNSIKSMNSKTVLDLGANTGWFSLLAENQGAKVISAEIDDASIDDLYRYTKSQNLNILPLRIDFNDIEKQHFGIDYSMEKVYEGKDFKNYPLFMAPTKRLICDTTICLALAHHLVLGMGMDIDKLFQILSSLTKETLILEFIGFDDNLIKTEPSFFPNINKFSPENYNIDKFLEIGKNYFAEFEILNSHPSTRKLIIFKRH